MPTSKIKRVKGWVEITRDDFCWMAGALGFVPHVGMITMLHIPKIIKIKGYSLPPKKKKS